MRYDERSVAGGFLTGDRRAHRTVVSWIASVLAAPRFRGLRDEWQDLRQEVLRGVLESLRHGRFDPSQDLRSYVQTIAHYVGRDALIRRIRASRTAMPAVSRRSTPAVAEDLTIDAQQVRRVMDRLPDPCRRLLTMFYYEQRSYVEISEEIGVPLGTVSSRLFRCVRRAASILSDEQDGTPPA